jgi:hypothetical protein
VSEQKLEVFNILNRTFSVKVFERGLGKTFFKKFSPKNKN